MIRLPVILVALAIAIGADKALVLTAWHIGSLTRGSSFSQTYETVDRLELDAFEQGCSLISVSFADDPNAYYAMGSAQVIADEPEPSKVRAILSFSTLPRAELSYLTFWKSNNSSAWCMVVHH